MPISEAVVHTHSSITILITDDHPTVCEGLAALLGRQRDMQVVGQASTGQETLELFLRHRPDVTILDLLMPGMNGVETLTALKKICATARAIVLTNSDGDEDVYASVQAGAKAYLLKDAPREELLHTVRCVAAGQTLLSPTIAAKLAARLGRPELTKREAEILHLVAAGQSNLEIGATLFISEGTVKSHVNSLLSKLGVNDRTQAVITAVKTGLVRLS